MAILTARQLDEVRQALVRELTADGVTGINFTKPQVNAAIQAVEDVLTGAALQTALSNAMNTATSPLVLTAAQKKLLVRWVLRSRFDRGND